jgi:hypothetical protein
MSEPSTPVIGSLSRRTIGLGGFMCPKAELAREKYVSDHADQTPDLSNTTLTGVVYNIVMGVFSIITPFSAEMGEHQILGIIEKINKSDPEVLCLTYQATAAAIYHCSLNSLQSKASTQV